MGGRGVITSAPYFTVLEDNVKKMVLVIVAGLLITGTAASGYASEEKAGTVVTIPNVTKPHAGLALQILKAGNARYFSGKSIHPQSDSPRANLAGKSNHGDSAYATILSCSDSRVPVERIFDAVAMDLVVVRVAGNVVDGNEAAAIEYALGQVHTPLLVVLGHSQCSAVKAVTTAVEGHGHALERNISGQVDNIEPAIKRAQRKNPALQGEALIPFGIEENVWQGVEDLFIRSPATRAQVKSGTVKVVGAIYDVASGTVTWLPEAKVTEILAMVEKKSPQMAGGVLAKVGHESVVQH